MTVLHLAHVSKCPHILDWICCLICACCIALEQTQWETLFPTVLYCGIKCSLPQKRFYWLFSSNGRLFWPQYSDLSAAMTHGLLISSSLLVYYHLNLWFMGPELLTVAGSPTAPVHKEAVGNLYFHLGGGWSLHSVLTLLFHRLMEDPTVSFMTSSCRVFLRASLNVFLLSRCSCHFTACSLLPLLNALPDPPRTWFSCCAEKAWLMNCPIAVAISYRGLPMIQVPFCS